jgi:hypothetical protein
MQQRRKRLARVVKSEIARLTKEIASNCDGCPYSGCKNAYDNECGFNVIGNPCPNFVHVCTNHNVCESDDPVGWAVYYARNNRGKSIFNETVNSFVF